MATETPGRPLRLLLIEDCEDEALLLLRQLRNNGFDPDYARVVSEEELLAALQESWDIAVTDHNMQNFDSQQALSLIKERAPDLPVIIVSGSIGEEFAVASLKAGAHDYIMKDNLVRLIPAIERELREAHSRREHRQAQELIQHLAFHDSLTGLVNRAEFERNVDQALADSRRSGEQHGLLYLDLDQFKLINDTCGHVAGDELLRQLAVVLGGRIREADTLARLGGDEFGVLLHHCPAGGATKIAEDILRSINDFRFVWQEKSFAIGGSIGVVILDGSSHNVGDLLRKADLACYAAKDGGRNRVHVYAQDDQELARRHGEMEWVTRIRGALDEGRFTLYKQVISPISAAHDHRHCEYLIRMVDRDGSIVTPGAFIPAAERYNLMPELDQWVVENVLRHISESDDGDTAASSALHFINLSGSSLSEPRFFDFIRQQLSGSRIPANRICFEITETAAITNMQRSVNFIRDIRNLGCNFALDDFGSGLSSFSYLKTIPVDYLKIDGNFVRDIAQDDMDRTIVEAINNIGHVVGLHTIAEFVENEEVLEVLQTLGVDYAQGYYLGQPEPAHTDTGRRRPE